MNLIIAALFSLAFFTQVSHIQATPVNNSEEQVTYTVKAEKPAQQAEKADVPVVQDETPTAPQPEPQPEAEPVAIPAPQPPVTPTSHEELMAAAGIQPADYGAVDYIISHESGWNPDATEPNSGAHGLPQALPYSKTGCGWDDAVCQLEWATQYANATYGGWWGAYAHWVAFSWW